MIKAVINIIPDSGNREITSSDEQLSQALIEPQHRLTLRNANSIGRDIVLWVAIRPCHFLVAKVEGTWSGVKKNTILVKYP